MTKQGNILTYEISNKSNVKLSLHCPYEIRNRQNT